MRATAAIVSTCAALAACGTIGKAVDNVEKAVQLDEAAGTFPKNSTLIPDINIGFTPNNVISLEDLVFTAAAGAIAYYVYDPLAPNWEIAESRLADDSYRLSMKLKRFHTGGDGEALRIFRRRAQQLRIDKGFADYEIVEFSEGVESSTPIAQRYSEGVLRLVRATGTGTP